MNPNKQIIKDLLNEMINTNDNNIFFLSIYIPANNGYSKRYIAQKAQTIAEELIKSQIESKAPDNEYFEYISKLQEEINNLDEIKNGIAVFAKVNLDNHILNTNKAIGTFNARIIVLPTAPHQGGYIGKTYNLRQFLISIQNSFTAIAITLNKDGYGTYRFDNNNIEKLDFVKADITMEPTKDSGAYMYLGRGDYKFNNRKINSSNDSIDESFHNLDSFIKKENPQYLVAVYSQGFSIGNIIKRYNRILKQKYPNLKYIMVQSSVKNKSQLHQIALKEITRKRDEVYKNIIEDAKKTEKRFAEIPSDIFEYINALNADTLFVQEDVTIHKPNITNSYLQLTNDLNRLSNQEDALSLILKEIWDQAGNIVILPQNILKSEMLLKLRHE